MMRDEDLLVRIANLKRGIDSIKAAQRIGSGSTFAIKVGSGDGLLGSSLGHDFVFRVVVDFGQISLLTSLKMRWEQLPSPNPPIQMNLGAGWFEYQRHMDYDTAKQKAAYALFGSWLNMGSSATAWNMYVDMYATNNGSIESAGLYVL